MTKPFDPEELRARVRVGKRIIDLQDETQAKAEALRQSLQREREMWGLLPICPNCRKIRWDAAYWLAVERYIEQHASTLPPVSFACCVEPQGTASELVGHEVTL